MGSHNLPVHSTTFVGRQLELNEITELLADPTCRLLTLLGSGGVGKTRLAITAAERLLLNFADGVWFISLQPINSAGLIVPTIAEAIHFSFNGSEGPHQQLLRYLHDKQMLLLLDNYEQLLETEGLRLLVDILEAAPSIKLLITSRETLNLEEEWRYPILGLSVPPADYGGDLEKYDAIQLLNNRLRKTGRSLNRTIEKDCVVQICRLVEGVPLAIEMTASWLATLPCRDVTARIQSGLLDTRLQNVPQRHHSMLVVFEESWKLLDESERDVFRKLSVFAGGFNREAAEQVTGANSDTLAALVDKSLIQLDSWGRYRIHELIRRFAEQKLDALPEQREQVLNLHCDYFASFLHRREHEFRTQQSPQVISEIEEDIDNVRAAWTHAIENSRIEQIHQMARCLAEYYDFRNWYQEGARALGQAVVVLRSDQSTGTRRLALGIALAGQGNLLHNLGEIERAEVCLREAVSVLRPLHATEEIAHALGHLNRLLSAVGKFREAAQSFEECITLAEEAGDDVTLTYGLVNLIIINGVLGKYDKARQLQQEALARFQTINHRLGIAMTISFLGDIENVLGDYGLAKQHLQEGLAIMADLDSRWHMSLDYRFLGQVAHAMGDYGEAEQYLESSLALAHEIGDPRVIAFAVITQGNLFCSLGEFRQAQQNYQQGLSIARQGTHRWQEAMSLLGLGRAAYGLAGYELSNQYLQASLALCQEIGWELGIAHTLNWLGRVATQMQNSSEARRCFHEALQCGIRIGVSPVLLEVLVAVAELYATEQASARTAELLMVCLAHPASHADTRALAEQLLIRYKINLDQNAFSTAQGNGQTRALDTVARNLLTQLSIPQSSSFLDLSHDTLTRTELKILKTMDTDLTYPEIAAMHHISLNTIKSHRKQIFSKLDVHSRAQAIQKAKDMGLI